MWRLVLFAAIVTATTTALRYEDADEGTCKGLPIKPASIEDANSLLDKFMYIPAGSRFTMYGIASSHPHFNEMRERELLNGMCLIHNGSVESGRGSAFGFGGQVLGTYGMSARRDHPSVYDLFILPLNGVDTPVAAGTQTITLTDHKTFVFLVNCIHFFSEVKGWEVMSSTPTLSTATQQIIRNHAASLGFNPDHFLFLNYDNCGDITPHRQDESSHNDSRGRKKWRRNGRKGRAGHLGGRSGSKNLGWNN